jgi:flagellar biosynthetic protein FliR
VSAIGPDTLVSVFVLFCRIGGCLMLMPGISSARVPMNVRLFIALAVTLALTPLLEPTLRADIAGRPSAAMLLLIASEVAVGALIGVMARAFFQALQFMASAAAMFIGFSTPPGAPIEDNEPLPAFATLISLTATVLLFLTDQHWEILRAVIGSYSALPLSQTLAADFSLAKVVDALTSAFVIALQISSPFIVYALIVNLMAGLANRLVPQIPVYFIATPFILAGGFLILYLMVGESLRLFMLGFMGWLARG